MLNKIITMMLRRLRVNLRMMQWSVVRNLANIGWIVMILLDKWMWRFPYCTSVDFRRHLKCIFRLSPGVRCSVIWQVRQITTFINGLNLIMQSITRFLIIVLLMICVFDCCRRSIRWRSIKLFRKGVSIAIFHVFCKRLCFAFNLIISK